jgi:hypothetical protein
MIAAGIRPLALVGPVFFCRFSYLASSHVTARTLSFPPHIEYGISNSTQDVELVYALVAHSISDR